MGIKETQMVDFNTLMSRSSANETFDPLEIFEKLPKSSGISGLYHVQAEILQKWFSELRNESDVVVELNTGGGKTLVGLLMALSTMRETKEGVVYLVENKQLVEQAISQATSIGIPAKPYRGRDSVDADFSNGKSILVGSYQALFNGKSVFGVRGTGKEERLGGVVIDDAHASLDAIREAFSFVIPAEGSGGLYRKVLSSFKEAFDSLDRSSTYQEFQEGIGNEVVGIPYAYWYDAMGRVSSWIRDLVKDPSGVCEELRNQVVFNWPLIKDNLKYCQVVVSRSGVTISALYPLLDMVPSFRGARRRIYMSATITDYGDMVRAYDLRSLTSDKIIAPKTSAGVGRRMILSVPSEVLRSDEFKNVIKAELAQGRGVVRLVSRTSGSCEWEGIESASPMGHDGVLRAVRQLVLGSSTKLLSLTNRYNGIDLPGDACRVLILEDLPFGANDVDVLTETYLSESDLISQRIAQRIEQGAGRGVRGASDHCVVLLVGHRLVDWVKRERNREHFSGAFKAQLTISDMISADLKTVGDYCEAMEQDFCSDEGWKTFHASELAQLISEEDAVHLGGSFDMACIERKAFAQWIERDNGAACQKLEGKVASIVEDKQYKGWLLYLAARIAYEGGDTTYAEDLNRRAHSLNRSLPSFAHSSVRKTEECDSVQADSICALMAGCGSSCDMLGQFDADTSGLSFDVSHAVFEEALEVLGRYLGFDSHRADRNGDGPDVYWVSQEGMAFALEAKNEKNSETPFHKSEAGQLLTARAWVQKRYPGFEVVPVSVHPNAKADSNASADNLLVLLPDQLRRLREETRMLLDAAATVLPAERADRLSVALEEAGLTTQGIVANYLQHFEIAG